jgi:hypothetical protein
MTCVLGGGALPGLGLASDGLQASAGVALQELSASRGASQRSWRDRSNLASSRTTSRRRGSDKMGMTFFLSSRAKATSSITLLDATDSVALG